MATTATLPPHLSRYGLMGCREGSSWSILALESVSTEVRIRGFVAQVCAKLVYHNNSPETLQVQAVYPVDEGAAVYQCEVCIAGRTIVTHCMEKKKAEKEFKKAVEAGHRAVMAWEHENSCDIFKLNLGNFPAGATTQHVRSPSLLHVFFQGLHQGDYIRGDSGCWFAMFGCE